MMLACTRMGGSSSSYPYAEVITAGGYHTCVLTQAQQVYTPSLSPPEGFPPYRVFPPKAAAGFSAASDSVRGRVYCWGSNESGQLGDGTEISQGTPVEVEGLPTGIRMITAGGRHTCALSVAGAVTCWGANDVGQLGDGTDLKKSTPVDVRGLVNGVQAMAAGGYHTCALTTVGGVKCWGGNDSGQLGNGTEINANTPVDVVGLTSGVKAIEAGGHHTCALLTSGMVQCWGDNEDGQLGDGTERDQNTPVEVRGLSRNVQAIAAGGFHTCALTVEGGVLCWGDNSQGQLGNGLNVAKAPPSPVLGLRSGVRAISAGSGVVGESESFVSAHTCALSTAGGVLCWGNNDDGELGAGSVVDQNTPVEVQGLTSGVSAVAAGGLHTCALIAAGGITCWGDNSQGQLGANTPGDSPIPMEVLISQLGPTPVRLGYVHRLP
jgi:alpha-tubulin suppressor-like RCC1 family protein